MTIDHIDEMSHELRQLEQKLRKEDIHPSAIPLLDVLLRLSLKLEEVYIEFCMLEEEY